MEQIVYNESKVGLSHLCRLLGISRQSFYKYQNKRRVNSVASTLVLDQVQKIRVKHRFMGTRKLYSKLIPFLILHNIKLGRDGLFDLLSHHNLLIRKRKRRVSTTFSYHRFRKYPNLIKDKIPSNINQIWVSDITYWRIGSGKFVYLSFITDVYSHKIIGYNLSEDLKTASSLKALKQSLSSLLRDSPRLHKLIHHSDRGIQYCSYPYTKMLKDNDIEISMTENGDPRENSVAERLNGIIKNEYLKGKKPADLKEAKQMLAEAVRLYNEERPHMSIENFTPNQIHSQPSIKPKKLWKKYYLKKSDVNQYQD